MYPCPTQPARPLPVQPEVIELDDDDEDEEYDAESDEYGNGNGNGEDGTHTDPHAGDSHPNPEEAVDAISLLDDTPMKIGLPTKVSNTKSSGSEQGMRHICLSVSEIA
jgi:hypothetical protein